MDGTENVELGEEEDRRCGCKGIRTCLICESEQNGGMKERKPEIKQKYLYCSECEKAWPPDNGTHPHGRGSSFIDFPGIMIKGDFVTQEEERKIAQEIDKTNWALSQSGRRKQDYGPKVNFKKKKLKQGNFTGLPPFGEELVNRFTKLPLLENFKTVELCNLEYVPDRGSSIDPHFDDFWLWGERLVTLNLLSSTYLSMTSDKQPELEVYVPMAARSLLVVYGPARNVWKHGIHREDIRERRLAITFRELTPLFLEGGEQEEVGVEMLKIASSYKGTAVNL